MVLNFLEDRVRVMWCVVCGFCCYVSSGLEGIIKKIIIGEECSNHTR